MNQSLTIKDKKYIILEEDISEYRKIYILEDDDKIKYRLLIEDYRNASFMYEKFHVAYINPVGKGNLTTIKIEDIKINKE